MKVNFRLFIIIISTVFLNIYNFYSTGNNNQVQYFYPSTNFITNKNLASSEYVIIKKLGEKYVIFLNNNASDKNKIFFPEVNKATANRSALNILWRL